MLEDIEKRDYIWAVHIWNMFDFGADRRNGPGPGKNHKGMVSFDRKVKKDSFYLYKAHWSVEPFVHICSKRFVNRTGKKLIIKVYSNQNQVSLYQNGVLMETKTGNYNFTFELPMKKDNQIVVRSGALKDETIIHHVFWPDRSYKAMRYRNTSWEKQ